MNKKDLLAKALYCSGGTAISRMLPRTADKVLILAYHRVMPYDDDFCFDEELISATPEEFEWQVKYLSKHYCLTSFAELKARLDQGKSPEPNSVIITFDDGFDDNYYYAFPILKKYNAKASFFVTTDYIGTEDIYWFDWVVFLCRSITKDVTLHAEQAQLEVKLEVALPPEERNLKLLRFLKNIPDGDRKHLISEFENAVDVQGVPRQLSRAMNWSQLTQMYQSGLVEIGSHTKSHPILSQLDSEELAKEVEWSRNLIMDKLACDCVAITYPVGGPGAIDDRVLSAVKTAGYSFAATYMKGINRIAKLQDYMLRRLHVERYTTRDRFASMIEYPELLS